MEKDFVLYEEAVALQALGFDEPCSGYWDQAKGKNVILFKSKKITERINSKANVITAPTYQEAFKWFKDKHDLDGSPWFDTVTYCCDINVYSTKENLVCGDGWKSYEEAELYCLKELIKIVKEKK